MKRFAHILIGLVTLAATAVADTPVQTPLFTATVATPGMVYVATLRNGFSMRFDHRELIQENSRLYTSADENNYIDIATSEIVSLAQEPAPPSAPNAASGRAVDMKSVVASASDKTRLDEDLINSVIRAESGFNSKAVSPKGARGLMQLMPSTAAKLGVHDSFDAQANVDGGTRYLRELLARYNGDLAKALAAYNAGPHRVEQYHGVPPYRETQAYVSSIIRDFNRKKLAARKAQAKKAIPPKSARAAAKPSASPVPGS
jgi:soluble lytic murein transglycosylase-like protein